MFPVRRAFQHGRSTLAVLGDPLGTLGAAPALPPKASCPAPFGAYDADGLCHSVTATGAIDPAQSTLPTCSEGTWDPVAKACVDTPTTLSPGKALAIGAAVATGAVLLVVGSVIGVGALVGMGVESAVAKNNGKEPDPKKGAAIGAGVGGTALALAALTGGGL